MLRFVIVTYLQTGPVSGICVFVVKLGAVHILRNHKWGEGPYFLLCFLYNIITKDRRGGGVWRTPIFYYAIYVQPLSDKTFTPAAHGYYTMGDRRGPANGKCLHPKPISTVNGQ